MQATRTRYQNTPIARLRVTLLVSVLVSLVGASTAQATTYKVTRTDDPNAVACATPGGGCSLRQALAAVNATPSPPDVINLPAGNYSNDQGAEFAIANSVAIVGASSHTTIVNGSPTSRVFNLTGTNDVVSISGVTITGGHAGNGPGGGIDSELITNQLSLAGVALLGNAASYGGGLEYQSSSRLSVVNSLVANNTTQVGGGGLELARSPAVLSNVTVTGNSGVGNPSLGGGIGKAPVGGVVAIVNSTIVGNSVNPAGTGGGGNLEGAFTIRASIIASGVGPPGYENCTYGGTHPTSEGYNIEDRNQCFTSMSAGDMVNTNPMLGPLASMPDASSTLALLPGSPAINAGNPVGCKDAGGAFLTLDQRGVARPQGVRCDIGAFEFQTPILAGMPSISGTPQPAQTLTCSVPMASSPDGPITATSTTWLRDGTPIAGAGAPGYPVSASDVGHTLACQFASTNAAGSSSAFSAGVAVTQPGGGGGGGGGNQGQPSLRLASTSVTIDTTTGKGSLSATCSAPAGQQCKFTGTLYGSGKLPAGVASTTRSKRAKRLGTVRGTIAAGQTAKLRVRLTKASLKTLKSKKHFRARVIGTVTDKAGKRSTVRTPLTIKAKQRK